MALKKQMGLNSIIENSDALPRILIFGKSGQIGWELQRSLATLGEVIAVGTDSQTNTHQLGGDFLDLHGLENTLSRVKPKFIVNAAAYTAVDKAENDISCAFGINAIGPALLARYAERNDAWVVHYSTDYVFDGSGQHARQEDAQVGPLSVYGQSKLEGEQAIAQIPKHLIFRTSWVYAARGANFAKTILKLASERDTLSVIQDQIGAPTGADLLADVTAHAIRQIQTTEKLFGEGAAFALSGIYHLVAAGECSWYEYAKYVVSLAEAAGRPLRLSPLALRPIPSSEYLTAARRPLNSRLNTQKLKQTFRLHLPHWQTGVSRVLSEIS